MNYDDSLKWQKYRDLDRVYRNCIMQGWFTSRRRVFAVAVKKPYPSFYISADYCAKMIHWMETGSAELSHLLPLMRKKLDRLYERYAEVRAAEPAMPKIAICERIVNEQAPELYMTGDSAYNFWVDMRKKKRLLDQLKGNTQTNIK